MSTDTSGSETKPPARPVDEILADIEKERAGLTESFDALGGDVDEAIDAGRERARRAGKKAAVIAPAVVAVIVVIVIVLLVARRRAGNE
jgi:t-SNARE complex subunit (syntaxin)